MKRLNLKYPGERVPLSWNFQPELNGRKVKTCWVEISVDSGSYVADDDATRWVVSDPWVERDGVMFQLVQGGLVGVDYRFVASIERDDGAVFQKISVLPVRED